MAKNEPDPKSFVEGIMGEFAKLHEKIDSRLPENKPAPPPTPEPKQEPKSFWEYFFGE
jgi:hypothetical protein